MEEEEIEPFTENARKTERQRPFVIKWNPTLGRHLVASSTISAGEFILAEPAIVQGPSPSSRISRLNESVCPICFSHFDHSDTFSCSKCALPMCSAPCSLDSIHLENECKVFQALPQLYIILTSRAEEKSLFYQFITLLRCLSTRSQDPLKWKQILQLQSNPVIAGQSLTGAIKLLSWSFFNAEPGRIPGSEVQTDEDGVVEMGFHCLGALQTNSFSELQKSRSVENLYFFTSLVAHSCDLNAERQFDPFSSSVVVSAIKEIKTGEPITVSYLPLFYSTLERQRILSSPQWGFACRCSRCEDPTEFGSFMGTLQCPGCKTLNLTSSHKVIDSSICGSCHRVFPNCAADSVLKLEIAEVELRKSEDLSSWLDGMSDADWIHPNHSILIQVKAQLCQSLGEGQEGIRGVSLEDLEKKRGYAQHVLKVVNKLFPGTPYLLKGKIQFHLWLAERELFYRKKERNPGDTEHLQRLGVETLEILQFGILGSEEYQMKAILEEAS